MNNQNNFTPEIIDIISWRLKVSSSKIFPHTDFSSDLHLDYVDQLLLIAELENKFNVYLSKEDAEKISTIRDANYIFVKNAA